MDKRNSLDIEIDIACIVHEIGIPINIMGYRYICYAIYMILEDEDLLSAITKELYPAIAKRYDSTPLRVERAIRNAITVTYNRRSNDIINNLINFREIGVRERPTNSEFIALIAEHIKFKKKVVS